MSSSATVIGIAVVERAGCYLVGTRSSDSPLPGYAEFPGGKCQGEEPPAECARRECREEAGIKVVPVERLLSRRFPYEHDTLELHFWLCRPAQPAGPEPIQGGFRWVPAAELGSLQFPDANDEVLDLLHRRHGW